jgi:hypothetical protein
VHQRRFQAFLKVKIALDLFFGGLSVIVIMKGQVVVLQLYKVASFRRRRKSACSFRTKRILVSVTTKQIGALLVQRALDMVGQQCPCTFSFATKQKSFLSFSTN